jgi:hypothetical protein
MSASETNRLADEVRDLLDTSSVGLYEFIWILRGLYPDARDEQLKSWASDALAQLLASENGSLVRLCWPSEDVIGAGPAGSPAPDSDDWDDPQDGQPYVAITRDVS